MFKPLRSPASTRMLTQEGDTYYSGKKMLYPSPASVLRTLTAPAA